MPLCTELVRVSERGMEEALEKAVSKRGGIATLNKKVPHFQTFGLEVFIFTADAAKTKKLGERNRFLSDPFHFHGNHKFIFTMDVKSLYTVIPHHDGLKALKFFFNKHPKHEPSTTVLIRLAELVLTHNNFSFDGELYQ